MLDFSTQTLRRLSALGVLSAALAGGALAQMQQPVLSGSTGPLNWTLYGPGDLNNLSSASDTLKLSAYPQAKVLGAKYQSGDQSAVLAFRVNAPLQTVYTFDDQELRAQGFNRVSQNLGDMRASAVYQRGASKITFTLERQGGDVYRARLDLSGVAMGAQNTSAQNGMAAQNNAPASNQAVIRGHDHAGVTYLLYGADVLSSLNPNPGTVSFSVPQGARITSANINENGDLVAQVSANLGLQQMMDFYAQQFRQQGFTLVNPTDTGAGGDNALTYIFERNNISRVSFSVEKEDNYRLVWDFQDAQGNTLGNNLPAASPAGPAVAPLYGYEDNGLRYDFYGPGVLGDLTPDPKLLRFGVPLGAREVTVNRQGEDVIINMTTTLPLSEVQDYYAAQLRQQGFTRDENATTKTGPDQVQGVYSRQGTSGVNRLIWTARQTADNTVQVIFNFKAVQ